MVGWSGNAPWAATVAILNTKTAMINSLYMLLNINTQIYMKNSKYPTNVSSFKITCEASITFAQKKMILWKQ